MKADYLLAIIFALVASALVIFTLWWRARRHGGATFWPWVERLGWIATVVLGAASLFVAISGGTDHSSASSPPGSTTTQPPPSTSSSAIATLPTTATSSTLPTLQGEEVSVPPPGCGVSAGVDVHLDDPIEVVPGEKESPKADLEYDDCEGNIYPGSNGSVGLYTAGPAPNRDQCEAAARRNSIGDSRSIHTMKVGNILCVITDERNVVAAEIRKLGGPTKEGGSEPPQPTITLAITRWGT